MAGTAPFSVLAAFSFILLVRANLSLVNSDHEALLLVHETLGISKSQRLDDRNPCNSAGVFCQRRLSNNSCVHRVTRIFLKSGQLAGVLSPAIGRLSELKELSLPNNQLVDQIPPEIVSCRKLEVLNLQGNHFSGQVPSGVSSLTGLQVLDLSSNRFSGNLNFLKYFPKLEMLSLENNRFSGKVPSSLQSFRSLRVFNISGNPLLEGLVPVLNQAGKENNMVPKRYRLAENSRTRNQTAAKTVPPSSSITNPTQAPAPAPAAKHKTVPPSSSVTNTTQAPVPAPAAKHKHSKSKKKASRLILGFLAGGFAGSVSGFLFCVFFKAIMALVRGRRRDSGPTIFGPLIKNSEDLAFLEKEDGLASLEVIGKGGCGEVYKKELPRSNGKIIAIKKIIQPSKDTTELSEEDSRALNKKMRQIKSEIQTVGQIRHRNLLPLLAHVSRPDCHYLVYEFMKNGSLRDMLNQVSAGTKELDWPARHKIALGVASGLQYLHMIHSPRIIHRDLKPENILLDDNMEARIADFGFAKAVPDAHTHVTTSVVAGTVGYIAPEYHSMLKFTDKCDVYSFGVMLGVMVMGKLPCDEFFQSTIEMCLVKWMRNVMTSDDPNRAIDPKLIGNGYEEQMLLVLKIACFCTLEDPKKRPNSNDIRCMLSQIKH